MNYHPITTSIVWNSSLDITIGYKERTDFFILKFEEFLLSPDKKCKELINDVKIGQSYLNKYPHELSGGQRQRVAIARAISINPKILILDESVSALDVSIQASILNLLTEIKEKYNLSYIFISHDLSVVKHMSDKIAVFLNGKIVEYADADILFKSPKKEYTKALLRSAIN